MFQMRTAAIVFATIAVLFSVLFAPFAGLSGLRHGLARQAFAVGFDSLGFYLVQASARAGDARAMNNIGALYFWAKGVQRNEAAAVFALRDAVLAGSKPAIANLKIAADIACARPDEIENLEKLLQPIVDRRIGNFSQYLWDCRYRLRNRELTVEKKPGLPSREHIKAAMRADGFIFSFDDINLILSDADAALKRRDSEAMYAIGVRMSGSCYSFPAQLRARYHQTYIAKTFELLLTAAEAGRADAYAALADIHPAFSRRIANTSIGSRILARDDLGWLEIGAAKGCWVCRCKAARVQSERLIARKQVNDFEFQSVKEDVTACLVDTVAERADAWMQHDDYLVYHGTPPIRPEHAADMKRVASDVFKRLVALKAQSAPSQGSAE